MHSANSVLILPHPQALLIIQARRAWSYGADALTLSY